MYTFHDTSHAHCEPFKSGICEHFALLVSKNVFLFTELLHPKCYHSCFKHKLACGLDTLRWYWQKLSTLLQQTLAMSQQI